MTEQPPDEHIIQAWNAHRPYLVDLAFRMLGDIGAAEDVVQDAFARLVRAPRGEIEDDRGWLIVVTSRLCLDQIRSARSRRERAHDAGQIEFVPGGQPEMDREVPGDPADRVTLDDDVRLALLVVLQRLNPAERVVFVLHDIFGVPFEQVAQTVGRAVPSCRQLARRARRKIEHGHGHAVFDVTVSEHRQVTEKFIAASAGGDLDGLLEVLAPDAWGEFDAGPGGRPLGVIHGAVRVARHLLHYWGPGTTLVTHPVAGQPALLGFTGRALSGLLVFTIADDKIQAVHVIGDPAKLGFLAARLGVTFSPHIPSLPVPPTPAATERGDPKPSPRNERHHHAHHRQHPPRPSYQPRSPVMSAPAASGTALVITPSPFVRAVFGPLTKILNPVLVKLAGRRHVRFAAQIRHVGRRSGRQYVTPASARLAGDTFIIPLTFGNQSDWSRNVRAAGGCSIRLNGTDYQAIRPRLADRDQAVRVAGPAFGPLERASFRLLGISQFLLLQRPGNPSTGQGTT